VQPTTVQPDFNNVRPDELTTRTDTAPSTVEPSPDFNSVRPDELTVRTDSAPDFDGVRAEELTVRTDAVPPAPGPAVDDFGRTESESSPTTDAAPDRPVFDPLAVLDPVSLNGPADRDPLSVLDPTYDARLAETAPDPTPAPPVADDRDAADARARENYHYEGRQRRQSFADAHRQEMAQDLRKQARDRADEADFRRRTGDRGDLVETATAEINANRLQIEAEALFDQARSIDNDGPMGDVQLTGNDWELVNESASDLAPGPVETGDRSALTENDQPPSADRTRPYNRRGGLRPPLRAHQTDLERAMPRDGNGDVIRHADPRDGDWFGLQNDGGPEADPTRSNNCGDNVLSLYETYMHARPRVSAPRTFDGYHDGDPSRPIGAEQGVTARIEDTVGARFEGLADVSSLNPEDARVELKMAEISLRTHLTSLGHGAFAFIETQDQAGRTHAFAAVNQNGTILYLDPQSRQVSTFPLHTHTGLDVPCDVVRMDALVVNGNADPTPMTEGSRPSIADDPSGSGNAGTGNGQPLSQEAELAEVMRRYELLGDVPPKFDIAENDVRYLAEGAHTLDRHGPDIPMERDPALSHDPAAKSIEGRIYGDAPWRNAENRSFKWIDASTLKREINGYVQQNWEVIRSDLAMQKQHLAFFDAGHRVGHGYYNKGWYGAGSRQAVYAETSLVRIRFRIDENTDPPQAFILTSFPAGLG
jgi:hypothetical protein